MPFSALCFIFTLFLGERLTPARICAITLGFTGAMVIIRPGVAEVEQLRERGPQRLAVLGAVLRQQRRAHCSE